MSKDERVRDTECRYFISDCACNKYPDKIPEQDCVCCYSGEPEAQYKLLDRQIDEGTQLVFDTIIDSDEQIYNLEAHIDWASLIW